MLTSKLIPAVLMGEILPKVQAGYAIGTRYYHTFEHALDVLNNVERVHAEVGFGGPIEVAVAALYHDLHYVVGDPLNEDKSALSAMLDINGTTYMSSRLIDPGRVTFLIWLTKYHFKLDRAVLECDEDARMFLDCDIFGFAAPWKIFKEQNEKLDGEFSAGIPRGQYLAGRLAFLKNIITTTGVFNSDFFKDKFEDVAYSNITTEIELIEDELRGL